MPKRIQLSRARGWRLPPRTVKVDRSTRWGNPYVVGEPIDMKQVRRWGWNISPDGQKEPVCASCAKEAVERFRHALFWDVAIHDFVRNELEGRDLACWCGPDDPCHADVLLEIANSDAGDLRRKHDEIDEAIYREAAKVLGAE
jgi:hypothetical protein